MPTRTIDLNCDLGESLDRIRDGTDLTLLSVVTSANIACGGHAGDELAMAEIVQGCLKHGVAIGAHPSYPDRPRFGRVELKKMTPAEIEATVAEQVGALQSVARRLGATLRHVKPHGALYHAAMDKPAIAEAIARAAGQVSKDLVLIGLSGAPALESWGALGFRVAREAFADRRYEPDRSLRDREKDDALIRVPTQAAEQAVLVALGRAVPTSDGSTITIAADTICIHSDTPGAVDIARAVRGALELAGLTLAPLGA